MVSGRKKVIRAGEHLLCRVEILRRHEIDQVPGADHEITAVPGISDRLGEVPEAVSLLSERRGTPGGQRLLALAVAPVSQREVGIGNMQEPKRRGQTDLNTDFRQIHFYLIP